MDEASVSVGAGGALAQPVSVASQLDTGQTVVDTAMVEVVRKVSGILQEMAGALQLVTVCTCVV